MDSDKRTVEAIKEWLRDTIHQMHTDNFVWELKDPPTKEQLLDMLSAVENPQSPHRELLVDYIRRSKVWIAENFGDDDRQYEELVKFSAYLRG